uniref:Predicted protein n=1 Tax=Hordeum vulgare subsp. vulgare TaxID=112509 RepID=F2D3U5_HORVV|nr:predicted protein [Hordeum vulgare subsp. vulgare]BAJ97820.1 predicted protein [Hordeum vulgare subsp. vulgare]BAJ98293.1 predicted protein [Hordeum vulgare subsp. vulgare]
MPCTGRWPLPPLCVRRRAPRLEQPGRRMQPRCSRPARNLAEEASSGPWVVIGACLGQH